ncbi:mevalonate kinase, partial [Staphylococcus aureus]
LTKEELNEKAKWGEKSVRGKQSGIDTQTIVSGKPDWFQKSNAETLKTLNLDGYMVLINTGVKGSKSQAVEEVHKLCEVPQYMS